MTAARDGDFHQVPGAGPCPVAEPTAVFHQIIDRGTHFATEVRRVRRELTRYGRLDERLSVSPGQGCSAAASSPTACRT